MLDREVAYIIEMIPLIRSSAWLNDAGPQQRITEKGQQQQRQRSRDSAAAPPWCIGTSRCGDHVDSAPWPWYGYARFRLYLARCAISRPGAARLTDDLRRLGMHGL